MCGGKGVSLSFTPLAWVQYRASDASASPLWQLSKAAIIQVMRCAIQLIGMHLYVCYLGVFVYVSVFVIVCMYV